MELSRDKVKEIINDDWLLMDDCEGNKNCDVVKELARIALASLEAEAVADVVAWSSPNEERTCDIRLRRHDITAGPLYTAPPAPASVPDLKVLDEFIFNLVYAMASEELSHNEKELFSIASKYISYARERFSAAMLQGAEQQNRQQNIPENIPTLRDGLAAIRNSGIAIDAEKIFAERDALDSTVIADGWVLVPIEPTYQMCEAMGLPWESPRFPDRYKAMIAAAPKPEVK